MDYSKFYAHVRKAYGPLTQEQVNGFNLILAEAYRRNTYLDKLAYILATVWHETAKSMQPVEEAYFLGPVKAKAFQKKLRYYPYYGRGYVQLTWEENYRKASSYFKQNFVENPSLVLQPKWALPILFVGMEEGWFTGKSLDDYLDGVDEDDKEDLREFSNARRIINGVDKQVEIGKIALVFEKALRNAGYDDTLSVSTPSLQPSAEPADESKFKQAPTLLQSILRLLTAFLGALFGKGK